MSREHAEIVRRSWEAYNRGDIDGFLESVHPECEFHEDPSFPEGGVYRGRDEIRAYIEQFQAIMADHRFEVEEILDLGNEVIALLRESARGKTSGVEVSLQPAFVHRFRGDEVIWVRAYVDRAQALADTERGAA